VQPRAAGESKWSFTKLFKYAIDGIVSFSTVPLRLPMLLGVSLSAVALLMLLVNIVVFAMRPDAFSYDSLIIFLIVLLAALQFLCIGVLGKYLAQMFEQSKNRPHYLLKEIIEPKEKKEEE
jgi:Mn2+/Fe2+ NRAMP family transporter